MMITMINNIKQHLLQNGIFYVLTLLIAVGLKYHYSQASSDDLEWILKPTTAIVEGVSGFNFEKETYTGYINREHCIIIAPSCAGVNFFLIAFCMTVFSYVHCFKQPEAKCLWMNGSFGVTYLLTLLVNALRIILSIYLYQADIYSGWLTQERLHRIEGVLVYFVFLCVFHLIIRKVIQYYADVKNLKYMNWIYAGLIPLCWYILITVFVPLLNASHYGNVRHFIEHCSVVLAVCFTVFLLVFFIQVCWNRLVGENDSARQNCVRRKT